MLRTWIAALTACLATPLGAGAADTLSPDARGRELYELRCTGCHSQSVHSRDKRLATNFDDVRAWVQRWSTNLHLDWSPDEVDDVAVHLNRTYYRFPCPPTVCKVVSLHRPLMQIKGSEAASPYLGRQ